MASKKDIILDRYAAGMYVRQELYAQRVKAYYDNAVEKLLALAQQHPDLTADKKFSFADNMRVGDETSRVIRSLYSQVYAEIKKDCIAEWDLANLSCDKMIQSVFGWKLKDKNLYARWFERNSEAVDKFFERTQEVGGLNLSQRVWKYTGQLRGEMEAAITVAMGDGSSAAQMSREVRKYLQYPDKLFRRVKGSDGKLHLSENAKAFHTGRGVYRSSYKNAMRLTRTETNAAYRAADEDRWERLDFVVGFEVKLSKQHDDRMPNGDICDVLAGKYPKGFKFTAWHPHCLCYVVPILAKEDDFVAMQKAILDGNDPRTVDLKAQEVKDVPDAFKKWIAANTDRINDAAVKPYFIAQNYVDGDISKGLVIHNQKKSVWEIAKDRRASRDAESIQKRWNESRWNNYKLNAEKAISDAGIDVSDALQSRLDALQTATLAGNYTQSAKLMQRVMSGIQTQQKWDAIVWEGFSVEQKANLKEFEKAIGVKKGRRMTHEQADMKRPNPHYVKKYIEDPNGKYVEKATGKKISLNPKWDEKRDKPFTINCQTTAPVYELRRMGFNIEAKAFKGKEFDYLSTHFKEAWRTADGKVLSHVRTAKKASEIWNDVASGEDGVFQIQCRWKGGRSGHTFNMVKEKGQIYFYDPQTNEVFKDLKAFKKYSDDVSPKYGYQYFRINNKLVNIDRIKNLVKESEFIDPIQLAAEQRHAKRDVNAIMQRLAERRARYALIDKTAKNVLSVAADYPELQGEIKRLQDLVDAKNYVKMQTATRQLAKYVASINKDLAKMEDIIPDAKLWHKQFSVGDLKDAYEKIKINIESWKATMTLNEQLAKFEKEMKYVVDPTYMKPHKIYSTAKVAEAAYAKQLQIVQDKIFWKGLDDQHKILAAYKTKSQKFADAMLNYDIALAHGDKIAAQNALAEADKIKTSLEQAAARRQRKNVVSRMGEIGKDVMLPDVSRAECDALIAAFEKEFGESADTMLRSMTEADWLALSDKHKIVLTKYTQTYCYLNEPLRGIRYSGMNSRAAFDNDMPLLTEALSQQRAQKNFVVRRGTNNYHIDALGKDLGSLKEGDEFVDGAFLSTAVKVDKGFHMDYNLIIVVPKGAQGMYAEPFSHYTDSCKFNYSSISDVWNGVSKESMGGEREWIGQRGSKFRVLKKQGHTIYLQMIGQLFDQVDDVHKFI